MKIVVTGGAGFIGSALIRHLIAATDWTIINLDKLTYAGNLESLLSISANPRYGFVKLDIQDQIGVRNLLHAEQPDAVMNLAAESHVDRSIDRPSAFVQTNIVGTYCMLEETLRYWRGLTGAKKENFRFQHISTDEVFGSLPATGFFREDTPYSPNSPYSASKASSDHLVRAWCQTYGLPAVVTNCSNNYGPYQFPEKLIPLMITRAIAQQPLPVYGTGENIRDWLYVDDHVRALIMVLEKGAVGATYNVGGNAERRNLDIVKLICAILDDIRPLESGGTYRELITFVADRPGHDLRYAIDSSKIQRELGWQPLETFETGLYRTVRWYLENLQWCDSVRSNE